MCRSHLGGGGLRQPAGHASLETGIGVGVRLSGCQAIGCLRGRPAAVQSRILVGVTAWNAREEISPRRHGNTEARSTIGCMIPIHAKQFWDFVPLFDWFGKPVAQAARPCS